MKTKQVNTRHKWCHLPYGGKEHQVKRYEVLVHVPQPSSTRGESSSGVSGWGLLGLAAGAVAVGAAAAVVSSLNNEDSSSDSDDADPIAVDKEDADLAEAIRQSLLLHRPPSTSAASTPSQDSAAAAVADAIRESLCTSVCTVPAPAADDTSGALASTAPRTSSPSSSSLPAPECIVCWNGLHPPHKIHHCVNGHFVCDDCR